jgi:hypothetical protein
MVGEGAQALCGSQFTKPMSGPAASQPRETLLLHKGPRGYVPRPVECRPIGLSVHVFNMGHLEEMVRLGLGVHHPSAPWDPGNLLGGLN